ncbi:hypothetical protein AB0O68_33380 [Streptomyces sp. NPDC087512]|uniref:hypothetical protein n=1 Tax=Streptomyces sp. NPDC087512 TaxID=3155059 RepID=UPI0034302E28
MTETRTPPTEPGAALLLPGRFFRPGTPSRDLHSIGLVGGRESDAFYRDRWSHDKVVTSTHGVNCTGSCRWNVFVKDGGRDSGRRRLPLVPVENFHILRRRQSADDEREV